MNMCELGRIARASTMLYCGAGLSKTPFMLRLTGSMPLLWRLCKWLSTAPGMKLQISRSRLLMSPGEQRDGSWLGHAAETCRYGD